MSAIAVVLMPLLVPTRAPTTPLASFACAWRLAGQIHARNAWPSRLTKRVGRAFTAMFQHEAFTTWVSFLLRPENAPFARNNPMLWHRTLLGYVSTRWDGQKTLRVLTDSYRFAQNHPGPMQAALLTRREQPIASAELGEDKGRLLISVVSDNRFRREGEWTVRIRWDRARGVLCSIAFSLEETKDGWIAYVGALQGGSGAKEEAIKSATKAFQGVRPKAMAIFALQEVVSALGIARLLAAGNAIQMSNAKHLIHVPWNRISFNYDGMWAEADGQAAEEGWFELPLRETRRTREEIKANKRPLYVRRYELFDVLREAIGKGLASR